MVTNANAGPSLNLRHAKTDDVEALVRLVNAAYHHSEKHIFPTTTRTQRDDLLSQLDGLIVAEDGDRIVGCVHLKVDGARAHFGLLATDVTVHGRGIGSRLIAHVEALAKDAGCEVMHLDAVKEANLIPFYERRGYRVTGETPGQEWNRGADWGAVMPWHMVDMEKRI